MLISKQTIISFVSRLFFHWCRRTYWHDNTVQLPFIDTYSFLVLTPSTGCIRGDIDLADDKFPRTLHWIMVRHYRYQTRSIINRQEVLHLHQWRCGLPSLQFYRVFETIQSKAINCEAELSISLATSRSISSFEHSGSCPLSKASLQYQSHLAKEM